MGKHIDDADVTYVNVGTYLPSEQHMLMGVTEYDVTVLTLDDGDKEFRVEGSLSGLMDLGQRIKDSAAAAQQRGFEEATGFHRGQHVRIGKGETLWHIESFSWADGGPGTEKVLYAHLKQVEGYNSTSAQVTRLVDSKP